MKLSPTMQRAVDFMREHGGLKRLPGGFWVSPQAETWMGQTWFGTTTVEALVSRGVARYTEWARPNVPFPIRCELQP